MKQRTFESCCKPGKIKFRLAPGGAAPLGTKRKLPGQDPSSFADDIVLHLDTRPTKQWLRDIKPNDVSGHQIGLACTLET